MLDSYSVAWNMVFTTNQFIWSEEDLVPSDLNHKTEAVKAEAPSSKRNCSAKTVAHSDYIAYHISLCSEPRIKFYSDRISSRDN
jgi:hypothetical protein